MPPPERLQSFDEARVGVELNFYFSENKELNEV
jgi:hypothetical protein